MLTDGRGDRPQDSGGQLGRWAILTVAAMLEVAGDAVIRKGLRGSGLALVILGTVALGAYGVAVNALRIDFSRALGAYVGVFALISVLSGRLLFEETVARTTWLGLGVILVGSIVVLQGGR
jgi:drug/metabolite transporter superfamily protein YnfA